MIAVPPFEDGAVNVMVAWEFPRVAVPIVGAPGTAAGVTEFDADDAVLVPELLVAVTVNVYAVPLVRPVTVMGDEEPLAVMPPGDDVTV